MFTFEYKYSDYKQLFDALANRMNTVVKEGWIFFPPDIGEGYMRYLQLPNKLFINIIKGKNNREWFFYRKKDETEYYTLRFDDIIIPKTFQIGIGTDTIEKKEQHVSVAYLTSSLFDWHYRAPAGTTVKGVNILIPKDWLGKLLGIEVLDHILPAYIALKSRSFTMEPMDAYYLEIINEIMQEEPETPFPKLYVMNRVQLLIERFFNHVQSKVSMADVEAKFKSGDIRSILEVERSMVDNFSAKPPSVNELARNAAMSTTKFKTIFKSVFGLPVYEYYQQKRMNHALELLAEGSLSVKEVGRRVGYHNISNFSAAFKKQFGYSPNDYLS